MVSWGIAERTGILLIVGAGALAVAIIAYTMNRMKEYIVYSIQDSRVADLPVCTLKIERTVMGQTLESVHVQASGEDSARALENVTTLLDMGQQYMGKDLKNPTRDDSIG